MSGLITKVECEQNREFIIASWGEDFFLLCLRSEGKTFLGLLVSEGLI